MSGHLDDAVAALIGAADKLEVGYLQTTMENVATSAAMLTQVSDSQGSRLLDIASHLQNIQNHLALAFDGMAIVRTQLETAAATLTAGSA